MFRMFKCCSIVSKFSQWANTISKGVTSLFSQHNLAIINYLKTFIHLSPAPYSSRRLSG
ncbi:hypothetical protein ACOSQ2_006823 [Xanthoceras sorbifolium]